MSHLIDGTAGTVTTRAPIDVHQDSQNVRAYLEPSPFQLLQAQRHIHKTQQDLRQWRRTLERWRAEEIAYRYLSRENYPSNSYQTFLEMEYSYIDEERAALVALQERVKAAERERIGASESNRDYTYYDPPPVYSDLPPSYGDLHQNNPPLANESDDTPIAGSDDATINMESVRNRDLSFPNAPGLGQREVQIATSSRIEPQRNAAESRYSHLTQYHRPWSSRQPEQQIPQSLDAVDRAIELLQENGRRLRRVGAGHHDQDGQQSYHELIHILESWGREEPEHGAEIER